MNLARRPKDGDPVIQKGGCDRHTLLVAHRDGASVLREVVHDDQDVQVPVGRSIERTHDV